MRGVRGLPVSITRCRGVIGPFLESASLCRGVWGVGFCTSFALSSAHSQLQFQDTLNGVADHWSSLY